jgi:hypothetical protein
MVNTKDVILDLTIADFGLGDFFDTGMLFVFAIA